MLRSKKKPGKFKERVVFKFQFHLTRVPNGWDKLKVSLIPLGGKARNKTGKAVVQYGTCRWPDPIVETTKLYLDVKLGQYDDKFYKLVVSARSRVLGEVTVNLAEYLNATPSNSIVLLLKNCSSDTLLHAKICSLTSLRDSLNNNQERDDKSSESGDDLSDHSVASTTTSQALSGPQQAPRSNPKETSKAWDTMSVSSRYTTDAPVVSASPARSTTTYERRRHKFTRDQQLMRSASSGLPTTVNGSSDNLEPPRHSRSKSGTDMSRDIIGTDKAAEELRMEAVTWQRRARNLGLEVQRLNEVLLQKTCGKNGEIPDNERELKLELQAAKQAQEETELNLRKQVDSLQRSNRELQAELASGKSSDTSGIQLRKAQDSNSQLVLAIRDLEESLDEQRKELEELSVQNSQLENELLTAKRQEQELEKLWSAKVRAMEEMMVNAQETSDMNTRDNSKFLELEKIWSDKVRDMEETINFLRSKETEKIKEVENELKELTDENVELLLKLNKANKELETRKNAEEISRLKRLIDELERKLVSNEEFHQAQHESNEKLMGRLQSLLQSLKNGHADLENQLTTADCEINGLKKDLARVNQDCTNYKQMIAEREDEREKLKVLVDELKVESKQQAEKHASETSEFLTNLGSKLSLIADMKASILQLEMLNSGLDMKIQDSQELDKASKSRIRELEVNLSDIEEENINLKAQLQGLEGRLDSKRNELVRLEQEMTLAAEQLAGSKLQLEQSSLDREKLEEDLVELSVCKQELDVQLRGESMAYRKNITKLEAEVKLVLSELETCRQQKAASENQVLESGKARATLEAALHEYKSKCLDLDSKVSLLESSEKAQRQAFTDLEAEQELLGNEVKKYQGLNAVLAKQIKEAEKSLALLKTDSAKVKNTLELEIGMLRERKEQLVDELLRLEGDFNAVVEELESCKEQRDAALKRKAELEKQHSSLERTLKESELSCSHFKSQRGALEDELIVLKGRLVDSEASIWRLKDEHANAVSSLENRVSGLVEEKVQFMKDIKKLEMEFGSFMDEAEKVASNLENEKAALEGEWKRKCSDIEKDCEMHKQAEEEFELQVEDLVKQVEKHCREAEENSRDLRDAKAKVGSLMEELDLSKVEGSQVKEDLQRLQAQADSQVLEFNNDKSILEAALDECKSVCSELEETSRNEKQRLETRITELHSDMQKCSENVKQERALMQSKIQMLEQGLCRMEERAEETKAWCDGTITEMTFKLEEIDKQPAYDLILRKIELINDEWQSTVSSLSEELRQWQVTLTKCYDDCEASKDENEKLKAEQDICTAELVGLKEKSSRLETSLEEHRALGKLELDVLRRFASNTVKEEKCRLQLVLSSLDTSEDIQQIVNEIEQTVDVFEGVFEEIDLHESLRLLATITSLDAELMKNVYQEYRSKVDYLEAAIESLTASQTEAALEQLEDELTRLQNQLSASSQRERDLLSRLNTHQLLEKEVLRLQQVNEEFEEKLNKMKQASTWTEKDERLVRLEMELSEAVQANAMCQSQLQRYKLHVAARMIAEKREAVSGRAFDDLRKQQQQQQQQQQQPQVQQQEGWDVYRKKSFDLETELQEMHKRYSGLSLKFAEVVAEKEELGRTLKSLQKSYDFQRKMP